MWKDPSTGQCHPSATPVEIVDARQPFGLGMTPAAGPEYLVRFKGLPFSASNYSINWSPAAWFAPGQVWEQYAPMVTEFWETHEWAQGTFNGRAPVHNPPLSEQLDEVKPATYTQRRREFAEKMRRLFGGRRPTFSDTSDTVSDHE